MGVSTNRVIQIVGAMVLVLCASAAFTQADESFSLYNKTKDGGLARTGRSALWERGLPPVDRHFSFHAVDPEEEGRVDRDVNAAYRALCAVQKRRRSHQERDPQYEFRPPYYDEVTCSNELVSFIPWDPKQRGQVQQCKFPYKCLQREREMFVGRRPVGEKDQCWELVSVIIPSGCDCMWPDFERVY